MTKTIVLAAMAMGLAGAATAANAGSVHFPKNFGNSNGNGFHFSDKDHGSKNGGSNHQYSWEGSWGDNQKGNNNYGDDCDSPKDNHDGNNKDWNHNPPVNNDDCDKPSDKKDFHKVKIDCDTTPPQNNQCDDNPFYGHQWKDNCDKPTVPDCDYKPHKPCEPIPLPAAAWSGLSGLGLIALAGARKKLRGLMSA